MQMVYKHWLAEVKIGSYGNGRLAILLKDPYSHEPIIKATINVPHVALEDKEVVIKDYAENKGMYDALVHCGIISEAKRYVKTGHAVSPVCDLLIKI